jgi:MscS family membrane protein
VWVGYRLVDVLGGYIASSREIQLTRFDDVLIPMLRKILRLAVVLVVVLLVLAWLRKPPTSVLGALGVGGVALAFAARDTLGNFFGSITVLFDRPFGIGDWIVIGDIEGTVERVGFRSTRVRTFYNSMITIPNSKMVDTHVDNYGARQYRRAKVMLSVTYDTPPEKIDAFCEGIRELIRLHPYTRKDYYHVYFNKFAASSLDILLYTFFEVPDWSTELRERHRLFIDILRLAHRLGVEFAFPTQTLWLERAREAESTAKPPEIAPGKEGPDAVGLEQAAKVFEEVYGPSPSRPGPVVIEPAPRSKPRKGE